MKTSTAVKAKISKSLKLYWRKKKAAKLAKKPAKKGLVFSKKKIGGKSTNVHAH